VAPPQRRAAAPGTPPGSRWPPSILFLAAIGSARRHFPRVSDWWQYLAAPFVYDDLGYLFTIALAMALFVPYLERRLGVAPTLILLIACGALGALAAPGLDQALGDGLTLMAGGNGIALGAVGAWWSLHYADARDDPTDEYDRIPVAVAAGVLLLLPLVESFANPWAGVAGGLVGLACGFSATLGSR
jgi:membrane associated rhomboid family serine protease